MTVPPPLHESTLLIILAIMTLGGACIGATLLMHHRDRPPPRDHGKPPEGWLLGIGGAIAVLGLYAWLDERDARIEAMLRTPARVAQRLTVDLDTLCPPRTDGMTDQVVMAIGTQADAKVAHEARVG